MTKRGLFIGFLIATAGTSHDCAGAEAFRIATYNLEHYLAEPIGSRPAKSPAGRAKIRESLRALNADVVALQEMERRTNCSNCGPP
jgi:endonuclease/exonuclease/phosphatase family metal-dependent hydrolase